MDTTETPDPFAGMSDGDIRVQLGQLQAEASRRASEDEAARNQRLRQELAEVKTGDRPARREHIERLSPSETAQLLQDGHLAHLGFGQSKRRGRR